MGGFLGDATAFQNNDIRDYATLMEKYDYQEWGNEIMYNGITGDQMKTSIFIGPTYYQRLKMMVSDKIVVEQQENYKILQDNLLEEEQIMVVEEQEKWKEIVLFHMV